MFTMPNKTKDKEKNALIARTAATNSVALISICEYHFQVLGTKKCHIPKPMEALLPIITNIFTGKFIVVPPAVVPSTLHESRHWLEMSISAP
jgi:hypothetical protein